MAKRILNALCLWACCLFPAAAQVVIDDVTYEVDTISQTHEGPGIVFTQLRIADFPLNVYLLETDLNNEYNRVETTQAYDTLGRQETLANAYTRKTAQGKKPIAACNANFWCVTGSGEPWTTFMLGTPFGAVAMNDTVYVNTTQTSDTWNGGPYNTGGAAIDHDKNLYISRNLWQGTVTSSKFSSAVDLIQINKRCNAGEVALFSRPYGRSRTLNTEEGTTFVYLNFKDGSTWGINTDMTFTVQDVVADTTGLTLGSYEAVLTAQGTPAAQLQLLSAGDEVTINQGWSPIDSDVTAPSIENIVEGNAMVMQYGELTERNYDETYNTQIYSRTSYGCDSTGKILYMMVIDKSTSDYGTSAGCTTAQMCQIWKSLCPDIWNVVNFDAGGSAQMMLHGTVRNTTTEGTPRAVADAWMIFSTAPGDDTEIAQIRFEAPHLKIPVYATYSPTVMGYNKYGEVVDRDVTVTYEIDSTIGTSEGDAVVAGSEAGTGVITAIYADGITVSAPIEVLAAEMSIRIKPTILIDGTREYPLEVISTVDDETYYYDPERLTWTVADNSVATITGGTLRGLVEGETQIACSLGDFSDQTTVKVEIAPAPTVNVEWTDWTLKGSGSDKTLSEDGVLSLTYSGGRAAYISLVKDVEFYSLPDKVWIDFTSTIPMQYLQVDFRSNDMTASNYMYFDNDEAGFEADTRYALELPITELGDTADLMLYPICLYDIRFTPRTSGYTSGANSITFHGLYGEYSNYSSGISTPLADGGWLAVYPNPALGGKFTLKASCEIDGGAAVRIYAPSGALVYSAAVAMSGTAATVDTGLAPGIYFAEISSAARRMVTKLIVR